MVFDGPAPHRSEGPAVATRLVITAVLARVEHAELSQIAEGQPTVEEHIRSLWQGELAQADARRKPDRAAARRRRNVSTGSLSCEMAPV